MVWFVCILSWTFSSLFCISSWFAAFVCIAANLDFCPDRQAEEKNKKSRQNFDMPKTGFSDDGRKVFHSTRFRMTSASFSLAQTMSSLPVHRTFNIDTDFICRLLILLARFDNVNMDFCILFSSFCSKHGPAFAHNQVQMHVCVCVCVSSLLSHSWFAVFSCVYPKQVRHALGLKYFQVG